MKKFLLKLLAFTFVSLICLYAFLSLISSTRQETLRFPNNENIVFLGNSHVECAINDSIIKNSVNFAKSNDNAEIIYCKVKLLKQYNPQLDTVIIGYDNVIMCQDLAEEYEGVYSPFYYDQYSLNDLNNLLKYSSFKYISSHFNRPFDVSKITIPCKSFFYDSTNIKDMEIFGHYEYLMRDKLQKHIEIESKKEIQKMPFDSLSVYFLNKTIEFCLDNNITPILLFTPHQKESKLDPTYYKEYYQNNYKNILFYDFKDLELNDSCFGDINHLNHKGAKVFSEFLEKEVLHKDNYINKHNSLN